jgi:hypothetical protein
MLGCGLALHARRQWHVAVPPGQLNGFEKI